MTPEQLADLILRAAGSGLRNYTTKSKQDILDAAAESIKAINLDGVFLNPGYEKIAKVAMRKGETVMLQYDGETVHITQGFAA